MVNEKDSRVHDALASLVKLFLPSDHDENSEVVNDRRDDVHDTLSSIIEGNGFLNKLDVTS